MDLKHEFDDLMEVEGGCGISRWILWRHFLGEYTEYWEETYGEAVGGPKYKYVDRLIRAYSAPAGFGMAMTADGMTRMDAADIPTQSKAYFVASEYDIAQGDSFYELDWRGKEMPEVVYTKDEVDYKTKKVMPVDKGEVLKVVPYGSDTAGRPEFIKVFVEEHRV